MEKFLKRSAAAPSPTHSANNEQESCVKTNKASAAGNERSVCASERGGQREKKVASGGKQHPGVPSYLDHVVIIRGERKDQWIQVYMYLFSPPYIDEIRYICN